MQVPYSFQNQTKIRMKPLIRWEILFSAEMTDFSCLSHRILEYLGLEGTCKGHWVQLLFFALFSFRANKLHQILC